MFEVAGFLNFAFDIINESFLNEIFVGYTPSSTSSSLMPASRTGSSLTNEAAPNKP